VGVLRQACCQRLVHNLHWHLSPILFVLSFANWLISFGVLHFEHVFNILYLCWYYSILSGFYYASLEADMSDIRVKETDCSCKCSFCVVAMHCSVGDNGCFVRPAPLIDEEEGYGDPSGQPGFFVPFDDTE
jgi:hypothetical protein